MRARNAAHHCLRRAASAAAALIFGLTSQAALSTSTVTTTESYDYDLTTGRLVKAMSEPGDSALCTVKEFDIDSAYGQERSRTLRNCKGASPVTPGAMLEAAAPADFAAFSTRRSQVGYSADRRFVTSQTNPLQQVTLSTSDGRFGLPTSVTDPNGLTTSIAYDGLGRKVLETHADKTQTRWTYVYCRNLFINGVVVATPAGASSEDCASVWAPEVTRGANGGMTTPSYFVREQPLQVDGQTANGPWTLTYYDTLGRPLRTSTLGFNGTAVINTDTRYTVRGQVAAVSEPYFEGETVYWTEFNYDLLGREVRRTRQTAAGQAVVSTAYSGLQTTTSDARQFATSTTQNAAGQIETITDAKGGTLRRLHDPTGRVAQTTDSLGNITSLVYDLRGRRTALYDPDLGVITYEYDALGQEVKRTDAKNQAVTHSFDLLGRMVSRTAPDLTSRWYFDAYSDGSACPHGIGKMCEEASDNGYAKKYGYDAVGRISDTSTVVNGVTYSDQVTYAAATGHIDTQTYPTGVKLQYGYSAAGHLSSVTDARNGSKLWEAVERDARWALRQAKQGNGVTTNWSYYVDGRVKSIQVGSGALPNISYQYDPAGNITQRSDSSINSSFVYDELNRLTVETRWGPGLTGETAVQWGYDAVGNIVSHAETGAVSSTYLYNSSGSGSRRPHAVAAVNGEVNGYLFPRYAYDENGNLVNGAGRLVTWTAEDMVRSVTQGDTQLTYWYGPAQQRVKEEYSQNGATVRTTVYLNPPAGAGLFFEHESGTAGTKKKHYVSADGQTVAVIVCTADPCTTVSNTTTQYWHLDALGSVMATTDGGGGMLERMAYEPFGKRRNENGATDLYGTLNPTTDRGFTGHEHMQEVGLINMNGRIFEPGLARFLSADPTVPYPDSTQSYNRYSYARNNPLRSIDPSGFSDVFIGPGSGYLGIDAWEGDSNSGFSDGEGKGSRILLNPNAIDAGSGSDASQSKLGSGGRSSEGTFNGVKAERGAGGMRLGLSTGERALDFGTDVMQGLYNGAITTGEVLLNAFPGFTLPGQPDYKSFDAVKIDRPYVDRSVGLTAEMAGGLVVFKSLTMLKGLVEVRAASQAETATTTRVLRDGEGSTAQAIANSIGGPTGGLRVGQARVRQQLLNEADAAGGTYRCWRCGQTSMNAADMHLGHRNVPTSRGGNLSRDNVCLEGAACNLSAGNRGAPSPGMSCVERGSCGAPYGR